MDTPETDAAQVADALPVAPTTPALVEHVEAIAAATKTEAEPAAAPSSLAREIDAWFVEHFHNSPLSRDSELFRLAQDAKADLTKRLAALASA